MANGDNISLTSTNPRFWTDSDAPGNSISPDVEIGQMYLDSANGDLYQCKVAIFGSQVWYKFININNISSTLSSILPASALSGSYNDLSDLPIRSFSSPNFSNVTTATKLSDDQDCYVNYVFPTSLTSLLASQSLTATLQYADDSGFSTNIVTVNVDLNACSGILSLTLGGRLQTIGIIPKGKYRKVTLAQVGGATVPTSISSSQEVLL
jgi:hypothetical protein